MEENKENNVTLKKLHLDSFIKVLIDLYESGVDYIDLCGRNNEEQDVVDILFTKEYTIFKDVSSEEEAMQLIKDSFNRISSEEEEEEEDDVPSKTTKFKLSDDDLNQLL